MYHLHNLFSYITQILVDSINLQKGFLDPNFGQNSKQKIDCFLGGGMGGMANVFA